ncbi:MAG: YeeE/YedE family protein [Desulfobacteraceae bacterium]|nr:YeeE/YedE family protein [Desulfobacteraceae bacterium]
MGGFFTAVSAMSLGGISMMFGLFIGAYLGLRYLYWEIEHLPSKSSYKSNSNENKKRINWLSFEPLFGGLVFLAAFIAIWFYSQAAYAQIGGLLLCGIAFGIIIQRSRFCFVRCFRDPFMTGEGDMARAVFFSIMISLIGFAILKWTGLRGEYVYIAKSFWLGGLIGGIIFGFGMLVAGGCGSGSLWRAAEGQVKLMLCVFSFSLTTSVFNRFIQSYPKFKGLMGKKIFIPEYLTYGWSVILLFLFFCICALIITWNEETEKFTIEI